jgi:hypothetical protein
MRVFNQLSITSGKYGFEAWQVLISFENQFSNSQKNRRGGRKRIFKNKDL